MKRILLLFGFGQLVTKHDLAESERRIKEFIAQVALEHDKAEIRKLIEQLNRSGTALKDAVERNQ